MTGLLHHLHDTVEVDRMASVGKGGVEVGVESPGGGIGVALYTWYLHKTAHGVACKPEMVLETHFGRILDLGRSAAKEL